MNELAVCPRFGHCALDEVPPEGVQFAKFVVEKTIRSNCPTSAFVVEQTARH
jgi:hypothetical protein